MARQCLDAADRAVAEVAAASGEIRGPLSVGLIPTVVAVDVVQALRGFRDAHPGVQIRLVSGNSDAFIRQVADGELDLAFLGLPEGRPITGVSSRLLARDRHRAVVGPDHALAHRRRLRLADLAGETFVDFPAGTPGRQQVDLAFAAAGLTREVAFEVADMLAMGRILRAGLGVALLAAGFATQLPGLVTIPVTHAPTRSEHVIWSRLGPAPAAAALLEQLGLLG
jgi:DNA-binding transcriptional LysR family regulator